MKKKILFSFVALCMVLTLLVLPVNKASAAIYTTTGDTYVSSSSPDTNYGSSTSIKTDYGNPTKIGFVRIGTACASACELYMYSPIAIPNGPKVYKSVNFIEGDLTYTQIPIRGTLLADFGAITVGWNHVTVPAGERIFRLEADIDWEVSWASSETANGPYLDDGGTVPTATNTSVPPTATNTPTKTNTPVNTPTKTNTPVNTPTKTNTPIAPTATNTAVVPPTNTPVAPTATKTNTPVAPTATKTNTPVAPTATVTQVVAGCTTTVSPSSNLQTAINNTTSGQTLCLQPGTYQLSGSGLVSNNSGITIQGLTGPNGERAIIRGYADDSGRVLQINGSNVGLHDFDLTRGDKILWLEGSSNDNITGLHLSLAGGECFRLSGASANNYIGYNDINTCGRGSIYGDLGNGSGKNGEGIYVGRAPEQVAQYGPGPANNNLIEYNNIVTNANELVDIKEGATGNVVQYNTGGNQKDSESGCFDSRGDYNVFQYNNVDGCVGAGVRLGGDNEQYGYNNTVKNNTFNHVQGYGIKIQVSPPEDIDCSNTFLNSPNATIHWVHNDGPTC